MIPALVLTAGLGTRLRPLSYVRAKGALPLAGEPLARRILRGLRDAGITDAVLNLHHLPHTLTRAVGDGVDLGMRIRYSWEVPVLGSAGGPRRALPLFDPGGAGDSFLIVNGDTLTDVSVNALVADHHASGALVTMAVIPNTQPGKYGGITTDERGNLTGFVPRGSTVPSFHFVGVQVADPRAFASVAPDTPHEVRTLYPALNADQPGRARIAGNARIERSVLWDDVVVEDGAMLNECVVADGVVVPADTSWHGVTLRVPNGDLAPGERIIDGLAVCAIDQVPGPRPRA